jgi:hypothetical protein
MLEKLMPRSDDFFDDFNKQANATVKGCELLKELLENFTEVSSKVTHIKDVEHEGDEITHRAYERLHKQFITPFDRAEIHRLLSRIDDVLDLADGAAERLHLYEIVDVPAEARELGRVLNESALKMREAVAALRKIKQPAAILEACKEINRLENEGDRLLRESLAALFQEGIDPIVVIRWKDIYDRLEAAIDSTETVANILENIVIKNS